MAAYADHDRVMRRQELRAGQHWEVEDDSDSDLDITSSTHKALSADKYIESGANP